MIWIKGFLLTVFILTLTGCAGLDDVVTFAEPAIAKVVENIPTDPTNPFAWLLVGASAVAAGTAALRKKKKR